MKTYVIKLDSLTVEAENEAEAINQALEYFKAMQSIHKHEIKEVK